MFLQQRKLLRLSGILLFVNLYLLQVVLIVNFWYNVLMSKKVSSRYLSSKEKKSIACSNAGKLGSSLRWLNHVKVETSLIRVNAYDRDFLVGLAAANSLSVASVVSRLCCALRDRKISLSES